MSYPWRLITSMVFLSMGACNPAGSPMPVLPTFLQTTAPTAQEPNEAYPTALAIESKASQSVSGISINLDQAWREGKQLRAVLCFTLPDVSNWTIWNAHLGYGSEIVSEFSSFQTIRDEATESEPARRCEELSFYVPPDADLSAASLTVESLGAYPTGEEYCTLYMPKIQQTLEERGIGITLECLEDDGNMRMQIAIKPDSLAQEEAEKIVFGDEFYTIKGPWIFSVAFSE